MRVLLRRMLPGLLGAGVTQLNLAVDVIIASLLPAGTVSLLYYADRVQQLPLGVIGTAVGTALLPLLSRQVRAGEGEAAVGTLNRAIEYALFLTLPAAVALIVSAYPVIWTLFGRGAFSPESARLSAQSLAAYALGLPAFVAGEGAGAGLLRARRHGDSCEGRRCRGGAEPGIECRLHGAAATYRPGSGDQPGGDIQRGGLGVMLARHGLLRTDAQLRRRAPRMLLASGAMGLALWATQRALFAVPPHGGARIEALAVLVGVGLVSYAVAAVVFGAGDWRAMARMMGRGRRRGRVTIAPSADIAPRP